MQLIFISIDSFENWVIIWVPDTVNFFSAQMTDEHIHVYT